MPTSQPLNPVKKKQPKMVVVEKITDRHMDRLVRSYRQSIQDNREHDAVTIDKMVASYKSGIMMGHLIATES